MQAFQELWRGQRVPDRFQVRCTLRQRTVQNRHSRSFQHTTRQVEHNQAGAAAFERHPTTLASQAQHSNRIAVQHESGNYSIEMGNPMNTLLRQALPLASGSSQVACGQRSQPTQPPGVAALARCTGGRRREASCRHCIFQGGAPRTWGGVRGDGGQRSRHKAASLAAPLLLIAEQRPGTLERVLQRHACAWGASGVRSKMQV